MHISWLDETMRKDEFGLKAAMLSLLHRSGVPVPRAFVIHPEALGLFIERNSLQARIHAIADAADKSPSGLRESARKMNDLFAGAVIPEAVRNEIAAAYSNLSVSDGAKKAEQAALEMIKMGRGREFTAVRPSVIRKPQHSFAGVTRTFLNAAGEEELWRYIKLSWASLFHPTAGIYRQKVGAEGDPSMSVIIQRMADAEKSGAMFVNFGEGRLLVEAIWGLGDAHSSGIVTPDEYILDRQGALIEKSIGRKLWLHARNALSGRTEREHVPASRMDAQVLSDAELRKLGELAWKLDSTSDQWIMDWCIWRNRVYILDVKPGSYHARATGGAKAVSDRIVTGRCASPGAFSGTVALFTGGDGESFSSEHLVVCPYSSSSMPLFMPSAGGFVANEGGRLCNFSILAREFGIPGITAAQNATVLLKPGEKAELIADEGVVARHVEPAPAPALPVEPLASFIEQSVPAPSDESLAVEGPAIMPVATKMFAKVVAGQGLAPEGAEGFIMEKGEADLWEPIRPDRVSGLGVPVWFQARSDREFSSALDAMTRFAGTGAVGMGLLIPVVRGRRDVDNWRWHVPPGIMLGLSIKTPAMALSLHSLIQEGVSLVVLDLRSLAQLAMGLERPDREVHESIIGIISDVVVRCRERSVKACLCVPAEYLTKQNIISFVRTGIDMICADSALFQELRSHIEKSDSKKLPEVDADVSSASTVDAPSPSLSSSSP